MKVVVCAVTIVLPSLRITAVCGVKPAPVTSIVTWSGIAGGRFAEAIDLERVESCQERERLARGSPFTAVQPDVVVATLSSRQLQLRVQVVQIAR